MPENSAASMRSEGVAEGEASRAAANGDCGCGVAVVYTTYPSMAAARIAARGLVEARLAACVNIVPGMVSIYRFEGRVHEDGEVTALVKTRTELSGACIAAICSGHPYANPAALVFDAREAARAYVDWIMASTEETRGA